MYFIKVSVRRVEALCVTHVKYHFAMRCVPLGTVILTAVIMYSFPPQHSARSRYCLCNGEGKRQRVLQYGIVNPMAVVQTP